MKTQTILWCWWYDRKDLVSPLFPIMNGLKNHFLFYRFKAQEKLDFQLPGTIHYWTDYNSPYQILSRIQPDKVVFMGIENLLTVGLRSACRKLGIKTIYLSHGLTTSYENTVSNNKLGLSLIDERYSKYQHYYQKQKWRTLLFCLNAILKASSLKEKIYIAKLVYVFSRFNNVHERLAKSKSEYRLADAYVVFTKHLARLLKERDGVEESRMIEIGPYSLDHLFKKLASPANSDTLNNWGNYLLMIDQPLGKVSLEHQLLFWNNLANFTEKSNLKLVVKLHPSSYPKSNPIDHPNCIWVRDEEDISDLIYGASGCFGYFSALLLPIILFKPVILFNPTDQPLIDEWSGLGVVGLLPYPDFTFQDFKKVLNYFETNGSISSNMDLYIEKYIYKADGEGTARLRDVLLNQ